MGGSGCSRRALAPFFLEQHRTRAALERKTHVALVAKPGENARVLKSLPLVSHVFFEIFSRGCALFSMLAYVAIHKGSYFTFEDAEFVSDEASVFG